MGGKRIYSPELMDDDSSDTEREMEVLELLADSQIINETSNQQSNTIGTVRNYFLTIMDNMKLPTG
ncbi:hypothetical protein D3C84_1228010 [compost metagenome]